MAIEENADAAVRCWLCGRAFGARIEWHHPVPKSRSGREVVPVHPICHRMIHANFTNAELAKLQPQANALKGNAEVSRFLEWIANKPPDFHAPTRSQDRGRKAR
jgi:hypothetical protein